MPRRKIGASKSRRVVGSGVKSKTDPCELPALAYKKLKLDELREDIQRCRDENKLTALSQLHRLEVQLHDEITIALNSQADPIVGMDSAELVAFISAAVVELPPNLQAELGATLDAVRGGKLVRLTPRGRKPKRATKKTGLKKRGAKG